MTSSSGEETDDGAYEALIRRNKAAKEAFLRANGFGGAEQDRLKREIRTGVVCKEGEEGAGGQQRARAPQKEIRLASRGILGDRRSKIRARTLQDEQHVEPTTTTTNEVSPDDAPPSQPTEDPAQIQTDQEKNFEPTTTIRRRQTILLQESHLLTCSFCPRRFGLPAALRLHEKSRHPQPRIANVRSSNTNFLSSEALTTTVVAPCDTPFSCNLCSGRFVTGKGLDWHYKKHHRLGGEKAAGLSGCHLKA